MEKVNQVIQDSKKYYPWTYMGMILLAHLIPAVYGLLNRYFIGYMSYDSIVVDQSYEGLEVVIEVILEMFPIAVLAMVAHRYQDKSEVKSIVLSAILIQAVVTVLFLIIILTNVSSFINWLATPPEVQNLAKEYFIVKTLAMPFQTMGVVLTISVKAMKKGQLAILLSFISVFVNFVLDAFTISNYSFSLKLGLMASAWNYFISSVVLFIISALVVWWMLKDVESKPMDIKPKLKHIFTIGKWSGLESAVRNAGYIIGVVTVVNIIGASENAAIGGYNTAMWVMWGIVLIPQIAWTEATNIAIGHAFGKGDVNGMKNIQIMSTFLMGLYMVIWAIIGIWAWKPISEWLNQAAPPNVVEYSYMVFCYLIVPYIFYSIGTGVRAFWIGVGQPKFIFLASAIVNIAIYIPLGLVAKTGYPITFLTFLWVSIIVFAIDLVITIGLLYRYGYPLMDKWFSKQNIVVNPEIAGNTA